MNHRLLFHLLPAVSCALPAVAAPNTINVAPATYAGSGIIGRSNFPADPGTPTTHVGSPAHLNDEDPATMGTTKAPTGDPLLSQHNSHGGVRWPYLRADYVSSITCTLACFSNGGWFGQPGQFVPPGGLIPGTLLVVPEVQITTNGGTTWTAVPVTSGYLAAISTHLIGADPATPTMVTFTMDLNTPVSGINGIRLAGFAGGAYENAGFLAVTELDVQAGPLADSDGDHIDDAWEELYGFVGDFSKTGDFDSDGLVDLEEFRWNTDPTKNDSDEDGLKDGPEVNTHQTLPGKADTDGDGLTDGDEVELHSTNPLLPDTDGDGLTDGAEVNTHGSSPLLTDTDGDGLTDAAEVVTHGTSPILSDTDSDGLSDSSEISTHFTLPTNPDTDGDGLTDGAEVNVHFTNSLLPDTDGDGLSDGAEINTHGTNPRLRDTDSDQFSDGNEIIAGTNPLSTTSHPANIARVGTAILGLNDAVDSDNGTPHASAGVTENINDGNPTTRVDSWNPSSFDACSYAGIRWSTPYPEPIAMVELTMATFFDGGWFGPNGTAPWPGTPLLDSHVAVPTVQITMDGTTWADYTGTVLTDYSQQLTGHATGTNSPTALTVRFLLGTPVAGVRGIRLIGTEGGTANNGFLGVFELQVQDIHTLPADIDGDGLDATQEANTGANPAAADTDDDGLSDGQEASVHGTAPLVPDTDLDQFTDGQEVARGTDPLNPASRPANIALAGTALIGTNNAIDADDGIPVAHAGSPLYINDENPASRVDTAGTPSFIGWSYAGIRWASPFTHPVALLELNLATFSDGGWFGPNNSSPGAGHPLTSAHLTVPNVQITTNGSTWTNYTGTVHTDYLQQLTGHVIAASNTPTSRTARFLLSTPVTNLRGIRLIGRDGGTSNSGFLGVFELRAEETSTLSADIDGDGIPNTQEAALGTNPAAADTDADGLTDGQELNVYSTNPLLTDTDGDSFSDGAEVAGISNPSDAASTLNTLLLTDSIAGFSGVQGQNGWRYLYREYTEDGGGPAYVPGSLAPFAGGSGSAIPWNGLSQQWNTATGWELSLGTGADGPFWTKLGSGSGTGQESHPAGTGSVDGNYPAPKNREHWAVRRWRNPLADPAPVAITWHMRKQLTGGNGTTGGIYINGQPVDTRLCQPLDLTGFTRRLYVNLMPGDLVDLVHTPEGNFALRDDTLDGAYMWMRVDRRIPALPLQPDGLPFGPVAERPFASAFAPVPPGSPPGSIALTFPSHPYYTYTVESSPDMSPGSWTTLTTVPAAALPFLDTTVTVTGSMSRQFFRTLRSPAN